MDLRTNAVDFIERSIEEFYRGHEEGDPREFKYAIIHLAQGCELMFKYILSQKNPWLIYELTNNKKFNNTVSVDHAIFRIEKIFGYKPDKEVKNVLENIKKDRNDIIHELVSFTKDNEPFSRFAITFNALNKILKDTIGEKLVDLISPEHKKLFAEIDDAHQSYQQTLEPLKFGNIRVPCPECGFKLLIKNENEPDGYQCDYCFKSFEDEISILRQLNEEEYNDIVTEAYMKMINAHPVACESCYETAMILVEEKDEIFCLSCGNSVDYFDRYECSSCGYQTVVIQTEIDSSHLVWEKGYCVKCGEVNYPPECEVCGASGFDIELKYIPVGESHGFYMCPHHEDDED